MALKDFWGSGKDSNPASSSDDGDEGWINIDNSSWSPVRPGDQIEGELLEKKFHVGQWDKNLYVIKRRDGSCRDVWGCYRLDKKMDEVQVGMTIRIRYKGEITKSDGNPMYDYDVLRKKE